jgi:hypothetical protein
MLDQLLPTIPSRDSLEYYQDISIPVKDKKILKDLAFRVAEFAARPAEEEKKALWYKLNSLQPCRPLVFCDPENGWGEIIPFDQLICESQLGKRWEMKLKKQIFYGESMLDDRLIEPLFEIPYLSTMTDWGMSPEIHGGEDGGANAWDAPLKDYGDVYKLHFPQITVDFQKTTELKELAEEVVGEFLEVRVKGVWWWSTGLTRTFTEIRGLKELLYDFTDHPVELKGLMAFLRDGTLAMLDYLEENNLMTLNNDGTYIASGGFGWSHELPLKDFTGQVRCSDLWGFGEEQSTVGVSPKMFEEFVFNYHLPILSRFGLNCYGCCEPLDSRWNVIKKIPNLRRVSVSPWANKAKMAEYLEDKYVFSMKPHPGPLAAPEIEEDSIRKSLRESLEVTRGCRVEIIMKDNHTLGNNPNNAIRWCQIAKEEAERLG